MGRTKRYMEALDDLEANPPRAYIVYTIGDSEAGRLLKKELVEKGFLINQDTYEVGQTLESFVNKVGADTDVFIVLVSDKLGNAVQTKILQEHVKRYVDRHPNKILIPVLDSNVNPNSIPDAIKQIFYLKANFSSKDDLKLIADRIYNSAVSSTLKQGFKQQESIKIQEKIESSAAQYLSPISTELQQRERDLEQSAKFWFWIGFGSLAAALLTPLLILLFKQNIELDKIADVVYYSVKSIVIVLLAISISKYSSNLARAYMNESRKVADRRHAISFGEFALKVSTEPLKHTDLKEIFKEWNISGNSSFMPGATDDHDPKLIEKFTEFVRAIKSKDKE